MKANAVPHQAGTARALILVIDDDAALRDFVRRVLEKNGCEVIEANDGLPAMDRFRKRKPDLVICDVYMPEQEGLETIREFRKISPGVRIISMSGGATVGRMDPLPLATRLGANATLPKPFAETELMSLVYVLLRETAVQGDTGEHSDDQ